MMVNKSKTKRILHTLAIICIAFLATACVSTQSETDETSSDNQSTREFVQSLSPQQKMTLLSLLESYDENQQIIDNLKKNAAALSRLVELEGDLRLLIMQLNSLNEAAQTPASSEQTQQLSTESRPVEALAQEPQQQPSRAASPSSLAQGYTIQLTAVYSLSHLRSYWQKVKSGYPEMFSEAAPFYERFTNAKGENIYRLKVGSYPKKDAAMAACRDFSLKGGSCFVTDNLSGQPL